MNISKKVPWLVAFLLFQLSLLGQDCAEDTCNVNCGLYDLNIPIPVNSLDTFEFEISDVVLDDLSAAGQGICAVELHFTHRRIRSLLVSLISPNGDLVQLIGPHLPNPTVTTTFGTDWNISFVRSIDPANPDGTFPDRWDNANLWQSLANYMGAYYPRSGNLEDFNSGPVNGIWKLVIQNLNLFSTYTGELLGIRLILCNPEGIECCDADGGTPAGSTSLNFCEKDSALLLNPAVNYTITPDTLYDFTWIIAENDIILDYDTLPDLTNFPPGIYEICGLGYDTTALDSLPVPDGIWTVDSLRNLLDVPEPTYCADVSKDCISIEIDDAPQDGMIDTTLCVGTPFMVGDSTFTSPGNYTVVVDIPSACDSLVYVDLKYVVPDTTFLVEEICFDSTFQVGDSTYRQTGVYLSYIPVGEACDSIVKLDLLVLPKIETFIDTVLCFGDSIQIGSSFFGTTGNYDIPLVAQNTCDSTVHLNLVVLREVEAIIQTPDTLTCDRPELTVFGDNSQPSGQLDYEWFTSSGTFVSAPLAPNLIVSDSALYTLHVWIDSMGTSCHDTTSAYVFQNTTLPTIVLQTPDSLNCNNSFVNLDATGSTAGIGYELEWELLGTGIINRNVLQIGVQDSGWYQVTILDLENGCSDSSAIYVALDTIKPFADAGTGFELNCNLFSDTLNGDFSSSGPNFYYQWDGPNILSDGNTLFPVIDSAGWYHLEVIDSSNQCRSTDSVLVTENFNFPDIQIFLPDTINCQDSIIQLQAVVQGGGLYTYSWSTTNGNIRSGANTPGPSVDESGWYFLVVLNVNSHCISIDSVQVFENTTIPVADAGPDRTLNCRDTLVRLEGSNTSMGPQFEYAWRRGSVPMGNPDSIFIDTDIIGTYYFEVRNLTNFCVSEDTAFVFINTSPPTVEAGFPDTITCTKDSVILIGDVSGIGMNFSFLWTTDVGCFNTDPIRKDVEIGCPGWYYLEVTNRDNHCSAIDSVRIFQNGMLPNISAGIVDTLDCNTSQIQLNGSSDVLPPLSNIQWSTNDGNIVSGANSLTPVVDTGGIYTLTITRTDNNCLASGSVTVVDLRYEPIANAGPDESLNCQSDSVFIGSASSVGSNLLYQWFDYDGLLISGADNNFLVVKDSGQFILQITDSISYCTDRDTIEVEINRTLPFLEAGLPDTLNCRDTTLELNGLIGPGNLSFYWATGNGFILNGDSSLSPTISVSGLYYFYVLDSANLCLAVDSVMIFEDLQYPDLSIEDSLSLRCDTTAIGLTVFSNLIGSDLQYSWLTSDGNIITDTSLSTVFVNQAGHYQVYVTNARNECFSDTVIHVREANQPIVQLGNDIELDCNDLISGIRLTGSIIPSQFNYVYEWLTGNSSAIIGNTNSDTLRIIDEGTFILNVTDTISHCSDSDTLLVGLSPTIPDVEAGSDVQIPCGGDSIVRLNGNASFSQNGIIYFWSTVSGNIISNPTLDTILVDQSGWYFLNGRDSVSLCEQIDSVQVAFVPCGPSALALSPDTVTCIKDTVRLLGGGFNLDNTRFEWTALTGTILDGADEQFPLVTEGTYRLYVIDTLSGQIDSSDVMVPTNLFPPTADAGRDTLLNCLDTCLVLSGGSSFGQGNIEYEWMAAGFNSNSQEAEVCIGGDYTLIITDNYNGCRDTDMVRVVYDTLAPTADAGLNQFLPCGMDSIQLDGSASIGLGPISYSWSTNDSISQPFVQLPGEYCLTVTNVNNHCIDTACIRVIPDQNAPVPNAGTDTLLNCRDSLIWLNGLIPSGNMSYYWNTSDGCILTDTAALSIEINCPGTYHLVVMDNDNNCIGTDAIIVTEDYLLPDAQVTSSGPITCKDSLILLDGSLSSSGSNFDYLWFGDCFNSNQSSINAEVCDTGQYVLRVLNTINGCMRFDTVIVRANRTLPFADAGPDGLITCVDKEFRLTALASASGPNFIFDWQPINGGNILRDDDSLNPVVDMEGAYILIVTDTINGCVQTDTAAVILQDSLPSLLIDSFNFELNCYQDTLRLDASASTPTGKLVFRWNTFNGNMLGDPISPSVLVDKEGWYYINLERIDNGCLVQDSIFVASDFSEPSILISEPDTLTCNVLSSSLNAIISDSIDQYSVLWTTQNGLLSGDTNSLQAIALQNARYTVAVLNLENGCSNSASVIVPIDTLSPFVVALTEGELDCIHTTATLNGANSDQSDTYDYYWYGPSNATILNPTSLTTTSNVGGLYYLKITNTNNGCFGIDSTIIVANSNAIIDLNYLLNPVRCFGNSDASIVIDSVIGGTPQYSYSINEGALQSSSTFQNLSAGQYSIHVEDEIGCTFDTLIIIEEAMEILTDLGPDMVLKLGDSSIIEVMINIDETALDTVIWIPEGLFPCQGCLEQMIQVPSNTLVEVIVRDTFGCESSDTLYITLDDDRPVFIPSAFSPNGDGDNDVFMIFGGLGIEKVNQFLIFDRWGELVFKASDFSPNNPGYGWDGRYNGELLDPNVFVYFAEITFIDGKTEIIKGDLTLVR